MKRPLSRGEKSLIWVSSIAMLSLIGMGLLRSGLDAEPVWAIPTAQPTPNPNGYDLYGAAAAAIIRATPPVDAINDSKRETDPKVIATKYSLARRTAWIAKNGKAWALFEQAKAADSLAVQGRSRYTPPLTNFGKIRELARCKIIVANTAKMRGDWGQAAQNGLDVIEMGGDIKRGAAMIGFLVGCAMEAIGENNFRDTPAHLNAKEARAAARRLEKMLAARPPLVDTMREEKWEGLAQLRDTMTNQPWRRVRAWGVNAPLLDRVKNRFLSKREVVENYKNSADWCIAQVQNPYSPTRVTPPDPGNYVNRIANPFFGNWKFSAARADTQLTLLLMRFALRAYRLEKGAYPTQLTQLTPGYLTKIPLDPFGTGTPLRYSKQGDSYVLWSIGPDGKNDNGKPIPPKNGRKIAMIAQDGVGDAITVPEWGYAIPQ